MIPRYCTAAMSGLFSDAARLTRWTAVEVAACEVWTSRGVIPVADMEVIRNKQRTPSPERVAEIEKETDHDVVAFVRALGEHVGEPESRHLHRALTSSDVVDTALAMTLRDATDVLISAVDGLSTVLHKRAVEHKLTPCVGRTHGIHAEPMSFGVRLLGFFCEMRRHRERLMRARTQIAFGKLSGAVGTFTQSDPAFEAEVLGRLGLAAEPVATQVIPRDRHAELVSALALLGAGLERLATDLRHLQRTDVRELEEPFKKGQTGSSAMPHKRNPITAERLTGMARLLRGYLVAAVEDVALWHERDISHSSVERIALPDAFHLAHYMLERMTKLIDGMRVYPEAMKQNLERTRGLVFSQTVLGLLLDKGLDRHVAYRIVQRQAMRVWEGEAASFEAALLSDSELGAKVSAAELGKAFALEPYLRHVDALFARAES